MGCPALLQKNNHIEGGHILTTPEAIVRQHRMNSMRHRIEAMQPEKKPSQMLQRILWVILALTAGWAIGYLHHWLSM